MQQLTVHELKDLLDQQARIQLIDVREPEEREAFHIGGELMPLTEIMEHTDKIKTDRPVILYCKMGIRSQIAIQRLADKFGWTHLANLQGGLEAWKKMMGNS